MNITFIIPGQVRGKGRPRFSRQGKFVKVRTDDATLSYENHVKYAFLQAKAQSDWTMPDAGVPIKAKIVCCFSKPDGWSKKRKNTTWRVTKKPDCDNIAKIILDALNKIAFPDDSQVYCIEVSKVYHVDNSERVTVTLETIELCS